VPAAVLVACPVEKQNSHARYSEEANFSMGTVTSIDVG
jgi:hypothetical protein